MALTTDSNNPKLGHGADNEPAPQNEVYLVLSDAERSKGFIRPVRHSYRHIADCNGVTTMGQALSETYARDPSFYGATYCTTCQKHRPVSEFVWTSDGTIVGS